MVNTFFGVYRLKHHEPKDKSSGPILLMTFDKSLDPEDAVQIMRFFGKQIKAKISEQETGQNLIETEFKLTKVSPKIQNKLRYLTFTITTPYDQDLSTKAVRLWDQECSLHFEEIQQELDMEPIGEDDEE